MPIIAACIIGTVSIQCEILQTDLKSAWDTIFQLIGGFDGHHQMYKLKYFANEQRKITTTNKENADILSNHYCKVFSQNALYDSTIIDEIDQIPQANPALGIAPNMKEIKTIINKIKKKRHQVSLESPLIC